MFILVGVQPFSITLFPFPTPHLKGAGFSSTGRYLRAVVEGCRMQRSGHRSSIGNLKRKVFQEMQPGPKAKLLRPTNFDLAQRLLNRCFFVTMQWFAPLTGVPRLNL